MISINDYKLIDKEESFIKEKGEKLVKKIKDSVKDISIELPCVKGNVSLMFNKGKFIYKDGEIIQCLKDDSTHIAYFNQRTQNYIDSSTYTNAWSNTKNTYKTDLVYINDSMLTGERVYGCKNEDNYIIDYNNVIVDNLTGSYSGSTYLLGDKNVCLHNVCEESTTYSYTRRSYSYTTYDREYLSKNAVHYIEKAMDNYEIVNNDENRPTFNTGVYFYNDSFYFGIYIGRYIDNEKRIYKIPTIKTDNLIYALFENVVYYIDLDSVTDMKHIRCYAKDICINTEYSVELKDKYVILKDNNIVFTDKPISKYPRIYSKNEKIYIVSKDYFYDVDDISTVIGEEDIVVSSTLDITSSVLKDDIIFCHKDIFFIDRDGQLMIFFKIRGCSSSVKYKGLEELKNLKYNRKSSDYYIYNNILYHDTSNYHLELELTNYSEKSIKVLFNSYFYIEDNNKNKFIGDCYHQIPLLLDVKKITQIISYEDGFIVKEQSEDRLRIQINDRIFEYKDETLSLDGEVIADNIKFDNERNEFTLYNKNELKELTPVYEIRLSYHLGHYINRRINYKSFKGFTVSTVDYDKFYIHSNNDDIVTEIDSERFNGINNRYTDNACIRINDEYTIDENYNSLGYYRKLKKVILYGWTIEDNIINRYLRSGEIWALMLDRKNLEQCKDKNTFSLLLYEVLVESILDVCKKYGIKMSKHQAEYYYEDIDFIDFIVNISNIYKRCNGKGNFKCLQLEINKYLNNLSVTNTYLEEANRKNYDDFEEYGIDISLFNDFNNKKTFVAEASQTFNHKNALQETLIQQIKNILGSREKRTTGVLQLFGKLDSLNYLHMKMFNESIIDITEISEADTNNIVKVIRPLSFKLFKLLKSYQVNINYAKAEIHFNDISFVDERYSKLLKFAKDINMFIAGAIDKINGSDIKLASVFINMMNWCKNHIDNEIQSIENLSEEDRVDIKSKNLAIKLWDRSNIFRNLSQGSRTHCCIALDSYNIQELVDYIINKNMVLVEIIDTDKDKVVGQGFVFIAATKEKINYCYKVKKHCFMVVDNVEINNKYQSYSMDIAFHFQEFMREYAKYVGNVSDVFLGTRYNDIPLPYDFKQEIHIEMIGNKLYRDSGSEFYKFI